MWDSCLAEELYNDSVSQHLDFFDYSQQSYEFTLTSGIFVLFGIFRSFRFVVFFYVLAVIGRHHQVI